MLQDDILCLVLAHPFIDFFLKKTDILIPKPRGKNPIPSSQGTREEYIISDEASGLGLGPGGGLGPSGAGQGRSVFSVRYRCLNEIIASNRPESKYLLFVRSCTSL